MTKPVSRKKEDRRRHDAPASLLGGFLARDRRSGDERRGAKSRPSGGRRNGS